MIRSRHLSLLMHRLLTRSPLKLRLCALASVCFATLPVVQADEIVAAIAPRIDELVVTGIRQQRLAELPRSANVITAEDIALSPSSNIVDLIAREANVQLRGTLGNDKFSGVDVRGQGDTYTSNVLVLIDGIRLNAADQSAPDYSTLPLDQVLRIEVIRGANSVRYGNGAVGGVINIITRRADNAEPGVAANARLRGGSYDTLDTGVGGSWVGDVWSLMGDVAYYDSDGYRDNSQFEKKDISARMGFDPVDWFGVAFGGISHRDEYGLPGPVSAEVFYDGSDADRRAVNPLYAYDGGSTDDDRLRLDLTLGNVTTGELLVSGQTRNRVNPSRIASGSPDAPYDTITEDLTAVDAKYQKGLNWLGRQHTFYLGYDASATDYSRVVAAGPTFSKYGNIRQHAWFTALDIGLSDTLKFSTGYRQDSFHLTGQLEDGVQGCSTPPPFCQPITIFPDQNDSWRNSAAEAGLVYSPSDTSNWFLSFAQSFRNPNVDDLVVASEDLGPQSANHWDAGVRQFWGNAVEFSFAVFYSKTKNEILYGTDPKNVAFQVNRNADEPVQRIGAETDIRWYATDTLRLSANAGYIDAQFEESGLELPLVPNWTGGLGAQWTFLSDWILSVSGNYVGSRFDGNDFSNSAAIPKLEAYQLVAMKLSYELKALQLYVGIDNIGDEVYAASAYSANYYPMPGRNYYAGMTYRLGL